MELFAGVPGEAAYAEFNFSPSSAWAAYRFSDYRSGMIEFPLQPPVVSLRLGEGEIAVDAELALPDHLQWSRLEVGLSAVIEAADGTKSFWAIDHADGAPDFHNRDCIALALPPPGAA
jgi:hypothetical protein